MATKRKPNGTPLGHVRTDVSITTAWAVQDPLWHGESIERVSTPARLSLTQHSIGWVLNLDGQPLVSLNDGDLEEVGLAFIRADARHGR